MKIFILIWNARPSRPSPMVGVGIKGTERNDGEKEERKNTGHSILARTVNTFYQFIKLLIYDSATCNMNIIFRARLETGT